MKCALSAATRFRSEWPDPTEITAHPAARLGNRKRDSFQGLQLLRSGGFAHPRADPRRRTRRGYSRVLPRRSFAGGAPPRGFASYRISKRAFRFALDEITSVGAKSRRNRSDSAPVGAS